MLCEGHKGELSTGICAGSMTNETHGCDGWTPSLQLQGDAGNAVLRAVDEGTLLCIGFVAANLEIRIGSPFRLKDEHAAQQDQAA